MHSFARLVGMTAFTAAVATGCASPDRLTSDEASTVEAVVMAQLEAFAGDDADGAFAETTPAVRKAIGNAGQFLALVRAAYPMVYRPAGVTFFKPELDGSVLLQPVEITDQDFNSWIALFSLERQPDASWRISGCVVTENRWRSI